MASGEIENKHTVFDVKNGGGDGDEDEINELKNLLSTERKQETEDVANSIDSVKHDETK